MTAPTAVAILRPVAAEAAEMLIDEALERADGYFVDLRRPLGWFGDRYDPHHREHLIRLALALLKPGEGLGGLVCWLPELKLQPAYFRCYQMVSKKEFDISNHPPIQELKEALGASVDSSADSLTAETIDSCLEDIEGTVGRGWDRWVRRAVGGVQLAHERSVDALSQRRSTKEFWKRAPSIQAFYRLQSTMRLPQVRRRCVDKILRQVLEVLGEDHSDPEVSPQEDFQQGSAAVSIDPETDSNEAPHGEASDSETLEISAEHPAHPRLSPQPEVDDASAPRPVLGREGCACFGFPFWHRSMENLRRLELVPSGSSGAPKETERSSLSCTISTLQIPTDGSQPGLTVTFEAGYQFKNLLDLEMIYRAYKQTTKHLRELEAGPDDALRPLLPASLPTTCGRSDCVGDISELDRVERVCPHCYRPILSRCGRAECLEEHLHLDVHGRDIECPGCGGTNHNLYWCCDEHSDQGYLSTLTDLHCPECLRQWAGCSRPRRPERIRSGLLRCPGCAANGSCRDGADSRRPFLVPQRIRHLVMSRRPVEHSAHNLELCRTSGLSDEGECPVCYARLVPFAKPGQCCSEDEPPLPTLPCGCCGFPLAPTARRCPRCRLDVAACPVCEVIPECDPCFGAARPPEAWLHSHGSHIACQRCATLQFPLRHGADLEDVDGLVCRNVYGCPIGGGLASPDLLVLVAPGLETCPVCEDPRLLPIGFRAFLAEVRRCGFCSTALGDPRHWDTSGLDQGVSVVEDEQSVRLGAINAQKHVCRLCSRGGPPSQKGGLPAEEVQLAALELGKALWVAKSTPAACRWLQDYWRGFLPPLDPPEIKALLLRQTGERLRASLCARLDSLSSVL